MKTILNILLFLILFFIPVFVLSPTSLKAPENRICFNPPAGGCFFVEVARTEEQRQKGLMFRERMDKKEGVFFVFEKEDVYPFWMKNTLIPLDIIWIDKDFKVVFIFKNAQPCQKDPCPVLDPKISATYVLEINAGLVDDLDIRFGDNAMWIK